MPFKWKDNKNKFKGEGIYFLTFVVENRVNLLGKLRAIDHPGDDGHIALVEATELGKIVQTTLRELQCHYTGLDVIAKQIMPNHLHTVVRCREGFEGSIKMVARSFSQACSKQARRIYQQRVAASAVVPSSAVVSLNPQFNCGNIDTTLQLSQCVQSSPYECGNGANTLFAQPFIRTLSHRGQLHSMITYVHANPDHAWIRHQHPDLYVIHRNIVVEGLRFDMMGKSRLLAYPDTQVIKLSRSLTAAMIDDEVKEAKKKALRGVVTYCGVMNDGEKAVTMAVRHEGYPLVVMLLDGFPAAGTEQARFYHPGGIYHGICGEGRLLLLDPDPANYADPRVIALTDVELRHKAELKHMTYRPIPHTSKRWRMIANNVMLEMIAGKG